MHRSTIQIAACAAVAVALHVSGAARPPAVDAAFRAFWDAKNPDAAAKAAQSVAASGVSFDDAMARLERGREYSKQIDRIKPAGAAERRLEPDLNVFSGAGPNHGRDLFGRSRPSGRVDAVRRGNQIDLTTRGVSELTLLLSPDVLDFTQPIRVAANGRLVFDGMQQRSLATLMKWAARDNDRTMLFAAELHIRL